MSNIMIDGKTYHPQEVVNSKRLWESLTNVEKREVKYQLTLLKTREEGAKHQETVKCDECQDYYQRSSLYRQQAVKKALKKGYTIENLCSSCGFKAATETFHTSKRSLLLHLLRTDNKDGLEQFNNQSLRFCPKCNKLLGSFYSLLKHWLRNHNG